MEIEPPHQVFSNTHCVKARIFNVKSVLKQREDSSWNSNILAQGKSSMLKMNKAERIHFWAPIYVRGLQLLKDYSWALVKHKFFNIKLVIEYC